MFVKIQSILFMHWNPVKELPVIGCFQFWATKVPFAVYFLLLDLCTTQVLLMSFQTTFPLTGFLLSWNSPGLRFMFAWKHSVYCPLQGHTPQWNVCGWKHSLEGIVCRPHTTINKKKMFIIEVGLHLAGPLKLKIPWVKTSTCLWWISNKCENTYFSEHRKQIIEYQQALTQEWSINKLVCLTQRP